MGFGNIPGLWALRAGASETDQKHDEQTSAHSALCRIVTATLLVGRFKGICRVALRGGLFPLMVTDITIHVESAKGTLERIDHSVTILVKFLKVVVLDLTCVGI